MSEKHTPTPWSYSSSRVGINEHNGGSVEKAWIYGTVGDNKPRIAVAEFGIDFGQDISSETEANAEFIVLAVNSHDALVKALRVAEKELSAIWSFHGQNLQVHGWHQNGDAEPLDNFFEQNSRDAMKEIETALAAAGVYP